MAASKDFAVIQLAKTAQKHGRTQSFGKPGDGKVRVQKRNAQARPGTKAGRKTCRAQIESVEFDPKDRVRYVTGFHKRKNERRKKAQEELKQRERQDRLEARAERRKALKEALYGAAGEEGEESGEEEGAVQDEGPEEKTYTSSYRTVTVVTSAMGDSDDEQERKRARRTKKEGRRREEEEENEREGEEEEEEEEGSLDVVNDPLALLKQIEKMTKQSSRAKKSRLD